jgi:hypothetical protein
VIDRYPDEVLVHPRHLAAQAVLADLIQQLRDCADVKDGYEFQQALLSRIDAAGTARAAFAQAVQRMDDGKAPQRGAPEPQSGLDDSRMETWQLERDVCERLVRQFKCVGDALAWRVFGFQRKHIVALCQNPPPGAFAGKAGRAAELARLERAYSQDGEFAILHDLTNCLRIGDVTIFANDGTYKTIEVKTNPTGSAVWFLGNPTSAGMHAGTLTFIAGTPGTYRYLCPVPGHAQKGMTGTFTVSGTT